MKLSISLGSFLFATIGSKQNASYILYGLPILEVKAGEKLCSSGDTVLSPAAWSLLDPMNYVYEIVKSDYVKVCQCIFFFIKKGIISLVFVQIYQISCSIKKNTLIFHYLPMLRITCHFIISFIHKFKVMYIHSIVVVV